MAIEQSSMESNYQANLELLRNCPTPQLPEVKSEDIDFSAMDFASYALDSDSNFGMLQSNQTIVFPQYAGIEPTYAGSHQLYPESLQNAFGNSSSSGSNFQFLAGPPTRGYIDDELASGRQSVISKMSDRKEKCMSRNAIAARENRMKKKDEFSTLKKRVDHLEQENALYKKKNHELKEAYKDTQERLKYYESVMNNLPSIVEIIEHMKSLPNKEESSKKLKKKLSSMNVTSNQPHLGVCFHVKTNQEMSLRFCETCSNGGTSKKKHVET